MSAALVLHVLVRGAERRAFAIEQLECSNRSGRGKMLPSKMQGTDLETMQAVCTAAVGRMVADDAILTTYPELAAATTTPGDSVFRCVVTLCSDREASDGEFFCTTDCQILMGPLRMEEANLGVNPVSAMALPTAFADSVLRAAMDGQAPIFRWHADMCPCPGAPVCPDTGTPLCPCTPPCPGCHGCHGTGIHDDGAGFSSAADSSSDSSTDSATDSSTDSDADSAGFTVSVARRKSLPCRCLDVLMVVAAVVGIITSMSLQPGDVTALV
jgi:hypothetical protein